MDRRRFLEALLGSAAGAAVAATVDVDRLLWVPGARRIFLPPPGGQLLITSGGTGFTVDWRNLPEPAPGVLDVRADAKTLADWIDRRILLGDYIDRRILAAYLGPRPPHGVRILG